ncbi:hypothetical protein RI367_002728 [Sorochytrium milnesiophthora]
MAPAADDMHAGESDVLYWAERDDNDSNSDVDAGELHLLGRRPGRCDRCCALVFQHRRLLTAALLAMVAVAAVVWWWTRTPWHTILDAQISADLREWQELRFLVRGITEGFINVKLDQSLPPYAALFSLRLLTVEPESSGRTGANVRPLEVDELDPGTNGGAQVNVWSIQPRVFRGYHGRSRLECTIFVPSSLQHDRLRKRAAQSQLLLNITAENLDYYFDARDTHHIQRVVMRTANGHITGRMSAEQLDVQSTNGNVDLTLALATPQTPTTADANVRVTTNNGDLALGVSILGASSDTALKKRDAPATQPLHILAHSDNGNVKASYTVPPVALQGDHYKDNFHVDFSLYSRSGTSQLDVDLDPPRRTANNQRLSPNTTSRFVEHDYDDFPSVPWTQEGSISTTAMQALSSVFGSVANITLSTARGDVDLCVS